MDGDQQMAGDTSAPHAGGPTPSDRIDSTRPHSARVWDYWLGGKDNYEVDRELGEQIARPRGHDEVLALIDGLDLVEPGLVTPTRWRPDDAGGREPREVPMWAGVARKP
jgi:hypothetical protein